MSANVIPMSKRNLEAALVHGRVKGVAGASILVEMDGAVVNAAQAVSCLVKPQTDDKVLLSRCGEDCHVIAVLERQADTSVSLEFPGDVRLQLPKGRLDIASSSGINLASTETLRLVAARTQVMSRSLALDAGEIRSHSQTLQAQTGRARLIADSIDTIGKRISQHADSLVRRIEGIESLHVGALVQHIRKAWTSHSQTSVLTARQDVRIDAERIHMG